MKELTKAEHAVMGHLWELKKAYLKDIVNNYPKPAPAYTTVSTVVNILVKKGFIGFQTHGKSREYFPKVSKEQYTNHSVKGVLSSFFDNSLKNFASYFASKEELSVEDLKELRKLIDDQIKTRQK